MCLLALWISVYTYIQVGSREVSPLQIGAAQISVWQIAAAQISHLEIDIAQIKPGQISTTEIKPLWKVSTTASNNLSTWHRYVMGSNWNILN